MWSGPNVPKKTLANPPLIFFRLYCAVVYYSRTFGLVKYKFCSPTQPGFQPFCNAITHKPATLKRCWNPFTYLNPKHSLTESYENQTVRHLRICHVHNCQTPKTPLSMVDKNMRHICRKKYIAKWHYEYRIALLDTTKHVMCIPHISLAAAGVPVTFEDIFVSNISKSDIIFY